MSSARKLSHSEEILSSLSEPEEIERFTSARRVLQGHLFHKREILNGRDFLFSGPPEELHGALKNLVDIEHRTSRFLQFDYAQIDDFFLLRVVGEECYQEIIDTYFAP
jgi:hypothetical protein